MGEILLIEVELAQVRLQPVLPRLIPVNLRMEARVARLQPGSERVKPMPLGMCLRSEIMEQVRARMTQSRLRPGQLVSDTNLRL